MKLTKAFGPLIVALTLIPGAQASVIYNTSLASPGFYNGNGNASSNFAVDTEGNLELGLSVIARGVGGGVIIPGPGSNVYKVHTSPGPLATWNFEFSVDTRDGGGSAVLGDYMYALTILDVSSVISGPSSAVGPDVVRLIHDNSGYGSLGKTAGVAVATEWGAQNSENVGFTGFLPGFHATAQDLYEITLSATNQSGMQVASVSVFADATSPEPSTMILIGTALIGLASLARKRPRNA